MRKILSLLFFFASVAFGQTYPSPTYNILTLQTPLALTSGGVGSGTAAGARTNLGLGTMATQNANSVSITGGTVSGTSITGGTISGLSSPLPVLSGGTGVTTSTGSGSVVLSTSPTLVTPALGTPTAIVLTNGTGLPISTGVAGLGAGVATALGNAVTGSGGPVLATSPSIASPTITGTLTATGTVTGAAFTSLVSPFAPTLATIAALQAATTATTPQSQVLVSGYAAPKDGGGGTFYVSTTTTADGCTIFNDASGRSWYRENAGSSYVNVKWCGAKGDGIATDTSAFTSAAATNKSIFVPTGSYLIADNSVTLHSGQSFIGSGRSTYLNGSYSGSGTLITCNTRTGNPCITIPASQNWVTLENFTLSGAGTLGSIAASNNGIQFSGDCNYCKVQGVELYNHYVGLQLAGSTFGWVQNVISENNTSVGVNMLNTTSTPMQWQFTNVLSQFNGAQGFLIQSQNVGGATQMTLGAFTNVATFANTGVGIGVVGLAGVPIYDIRISNSFFGQDGNSELYLQPFGGNINITGTQIELAGTTTTGPNNSTAASNTGYGIQILNGTSYVVSSNWINQNSQGGISTTGLGVNITGNVITNNGANGTAGTAIGIINNATGTLDINGNTIQNTGSGTLQKFAVSNGGTINVSVGNNMKTNATGTYTGTAATIGGATLNNQ